MFLYAYFSPLESLSSVPYCFGLTITCIIVKNTFLYKEPFREENSNNRRAMFKVFFGKHKGTCSLNIKEHVPLFLQIVLNHV